MFRKRFLTQRPQAVAQRAEQIRRMQELRWMLAELDSPCLPYASDLFAASEDGDPEYPSFPAFH